MENAGVRRDDGKAAILRLEKRQTETLVMRRADEDVGFLKQLLNTFPWLIAMQGHAGKRLEHTPVIAPAPSPDNVQGGIGKTVAAQCAYDFRGGDEVLSRLHGSKRHKPQRLRIARGVAVGVEIEHVADRRPIERNRGIMPAMGGKLAAGIAGIDQKA